MQTTQELPKWFTLKELLEFLESVPSETLTCNVDANKICTTCPMAKFLSLKIGEPVVCHWTAYTLVRDCSTEKDWITNVPKWMQGIVNKADKPKTTYGELVKYVRELIVLGV